MADFKRRPSRDSGSRDSGRSGSRDSGRFSRDSGSRDSGRSGSRDSGRFSRDSGSRDSGRSGSRGSSRSGGRDRRGSDCPEMTTVTCDSCKQRCEVPFKPSSDKPIYCSDCFRKESPRGDFGSRGRSKSSDNSQQLAEINQKLDKIMKSLGVD